MTKPKSCQESVRISGRISVRVCKSCQLLETLIVISTKNIIVFLGGWGACKLFSNNFTMAIKTAVIVLLFLKHCHEKRAKISWDLICTHIEVDNFESNRSFFFKFWPNSMLTPILKKKIYSVSQVVSFTSSRLWLRGLRKNKQTDNLIALQT